MMKGILKWGLYILIGLLLAMAIVPFVFRDKIEAIVKDEINKNVNAKVDFRSVDLSLFKSFPQLNVAIEGLSVTGVDTFQNIKLFDCKNINVAAPLKILFSDEATEITELNLDQPDINIVVINENVANYLISKNTSSSSGDSNLALKLKNYSVHDGHIRYQDYQNDRIFEMGGFDHEGSGDMSQMVFTLKTHSQSDTINFVNAGVHYLTNATGEVDANLMVDLNKNNYSFTDAVISLNALEAKANGEVELRPEDIYLSLTFDSGDQEFKDFMSVVPGFFLNNMKDVTSKGTASVLGKISGVYNGDIPKYPNFDIHIKVDQGYLNYTASPKALSDVFAKLVIRSSTQDMSDLIIDASDFRFNMGSDYVKGKFSLDQQKVSGDVDANINLSNWKDFIPQNTIKTLEGMIVGNMALNAKMTDISNQNLENIIFNGQVKSENIKVETNSGPMASVKSLNATFSPKVIDVQPTTVQYGKSDFLVSANIDRPLDIMLPDRNSVITVKSSSEMIDLNEFITTETASATTSQDSLANAFDLENVQKNQTKLNVDATAKNIIFNEYNLKNVELKGQASGQSLDLQNGRFAIKESDFSLHGKLDGLSEYFFNNGILNGNLHFSSNYLNMNEFMQEEPVSQSKDELAFIAIPKNTNIDMAVDVAKMKYNQMDLKNIDGHVIVKDQKAALQEVFAESMGGKVAIEGSYATLTDAKPHAEIKLALDQITFAEAIKQLTTFKKIIPIAEYIDGKFNTNLAFSSDLGDDMMPVLSSINSSGFLETLNAVISDFAPFQKVDALLGTSLFKEVNLENTKNWFDITDGRFNLTPVDRKIKGVDMNFAGYHYLEGDMKYDIKMKIPRNMLQGNSVTGTLDQGLKLLSAEAGKLGLNIANGEFIDVLVTITGSIKSPKVAFKPLGSSGGSVTDDISNSVKDKINETTDKVKDEVNKKTEEIKDSISTVVNEKVSEVKDKVNETKDKAVDSVKKVVVKKVGDQIDKNLPDTIGGVSKDDIKKKAEEQADKIKDDLNKWNPFKKKKN